MISVLALTMGGPLMLLLGIMVAAVLGVAGGFMIGTQIGKTRPETPLPTTVRLTRDVLASTCTDLDKASRKLSEAQRSEMSGTALVLSRRIAELSNQLGHLGRKAQHQQEGSS